jgi:hypothetical protein
MHHLMQKLVDFRTKKQERRGQVIWRESDRIIVSAAYYNIDEGQFRERRA